MPNLHVLGYINPSTVLMYSYHSDQNSGTFDVHLLKMDVKNGVIKNAQTIEIPTHIEFNEETDPQFTPFNLTLSPDKKRIAYLLPSDPYSPFGHGLISLLISSALSGRHGAQSQTNTAIWISNVDGSHIRALKRWRRNEDNDCDLEWRPDGKALSWVHYKKKKDNIDGDHSIKLLHL